MDERLKSLDVLRGLNMFMLTVFTAWLIEFCHVVPGLEWLQPQFHHNPFGSNTPNYDRERYSCFDEGKAMN